MYLLFGTVCFSDKQHFNQKGSVKGQAKFSLPKSCDPPEWLCMCFQYHGWTKFLLPQRTRHVNPADVSTKLNKTDNALLRQELESKQTVIFSFPQTNNREAAAQNQTQVIS